MLKSSYSLVLLVLLSFCRFSEIEVGSDYSYKGKFNSYKTFSFVENETFEGTDTEKKMIEHHVTRVLERWGYRHKKGKSNFLIFYNFYIEDVKLRSYNQPEFHYWVHSKFGKKLTVMENDTSSYNDSDGIRTKDEVYNSNNLSLREGTIHITFFDRKKDESVWQGYASGVFGSNIVKNERTVQAAIIRILDEFRLVIPST
ncbi:MAG: DUF4136 domain-containing protein [Bacteroidota bacterium]